LDSIQFICISIIHCLCLKKKTPVHLTCGLLRVCAACRTLRLNLKFELRPSWNIIYDTFPTGTAQDTTPCLYNQSVKPLIHITTLYYNYRLHRLHLLYLFFVNKQRAFQRFLEMGTNLGIPDHRRSRYRTNGDNLRRIR